MLLSLVLRSSAIGAANGDDDDDDAGSDGNDGGYDGGLKSIRVDTPVSSALPIAAALCFIPRRIYRHLWVAFTECLFPRRRRPDASTADSPFPLSATSAV